MSNSKKDCNFILFRHKRDERDAFDGCSFLERSRMELNEKGPITLYRERYTLAETRRYAEEGVAGAQYAMGEIYYYGTGDASDMDIAIDWYTKAAEQGDVDAQYKLGHIYLIGECKKVDYKEAEKWFLRAAKQGDRNAQYELANIYHQGFEGVKQNFKKAFYWYSKAAEQEGHLGQSMVASMYAKGEGVEQDYGKALEWYLRAGYRGDEFCVCTIGRYYKYGLGTDVDYIKARIWFKKGIRLFSDRALCELGLLYLEGGKNLKKDLVKAKNYFTRAHRRDEEFGTCYLDFLAENRENADYNHFKQWLFSQAESGNKTAQAGLGNSYYWGFVTEVDEEKYWEWDKKAYDWFYKKKELEGEEKENYEYRICKDMPAYMKAYYTRLARESKKTTIATNQ